MLQTTDVPATLDRLKDSRPNGIRTLKANVKLLSAKGITLWLKEQFGESGVWFTPDGYEAVTRLTGGHPRC